MAGTVYDCMGQQYQYSACSLQLLRRAAVTLTLPTRISTAYLLLSLKTCTFQQNRFRHRWNEKGPISAFPLLAPTNSIKAMKVKISYSANLLTHPKLTWGSSKLVIGLVFNGTFSTNRLYHAIGEWLISCRAGDKTNKSYN